MHLMPKDLEKLMLHYAGEVAKQRHDRGLKLNYTEAIAYISREILEGARDGMTVLALVEAGGKMLTADDCMDGVPSMVTNIQVEATFPDGTKLVSINNPIKTGNVVPSIIPGETVLANGDIQINAGKSAITLSVANTGSRPIQVGSHFHFFETNAFLDFDRTKAYGFRLDIPSGTAVRFEPNESKTVSLIPIAGRRKVCGAKGMVSGFLDENKLEAQSQLKELKGGKSK